jgi:hypothetical protein
VDINAFVGLRPFVFHTTAATNMSLLRELRVVESTRALLRRAGGADDGLLRRRREKSVAIKAGVHEVVIRDQRPLAVGAIEFDAGWDLGRLVELLNGLAFFWPGAEHGPIPYGRNHLERYVAEKEPLAILRISTRALVQANAPKAPMFSRCNSGAARMNAGRKLPRGGKTFLPASAFNGTPGDVKELVFSDSAVLPESTEWASGLEGPWRPFP